MKVGSYTVTVVQAERFRLDGGGMFGVVPKALWSRDHPADDRNRIEMVARCLLVRGEGRVVLLDTGMGGDWSDRERDVYAIEGDGRSIVAALGRAGVRPSDVTDVVLTHLHFDHAGGGVTREGRRSRPTFPRARYHVQREQHRWALNPTSRDRRSFRPSDFTPLEEAGCLELVEGRAEIAPGIEVIPTQGHTAGHQVVRIGDERESVLYCGDFLPLASHLPEPWVMSFDLHPLTTMKEKRTLLGQAADGQWLLVLEHDPRWDAVRVAREGDWFTAVERLSLTS